MSILPERTEFALNVYRMNDFDWVAAESLDDARKVYEVHCKEVGCYDDFDMDEISKLTEEDLDRCSYHDENAGKTMTFREALKGMEGPGFFATTEF